LSSGDIVAGKSTVPVGTATGIQSKITHTGAHLAWNPEFLREGWAVQDTLAPDRIVVGVPDGEEGIEVAARLRQLYSMVDEKNIPYLVTDFATAELVKVAA